MGRTIQAEGVILRSLRLGEADRVLHVYTRERGRVGVVAKGVRRTRSRFGARLEPLTRVNLMLHLGRGELGTVTGADIVASHRLVREDPDRLAVGLAGAETVARLFAEGEASPKAFEALCRFLEALETRAAPSRPIAREPLLLALGLKLHWVAGFAPVLDRCANCGAVDSFARAVLGRDRWRDVRCLPGRVRDPPRHDRGTRRAASRAARRGACAAGPTRRRGRARDRRAARRARRVPAALAGPRRVSKRALALAAAALAATAVLLVLERALVGIPFGSDAYSYLVWGRDAVEHGTTHHSQFDYTVPKPLELGVAAFGQLIGAPLALFGGWTVLGQLGAVAAVALLAGRLGGPRAAVAGGILALALPVLWRGGPAGDSNVPYAALVVAAAAFPAATVPSAALLGVAGLLRPEAWGLAVIAAVLGWHRADGRERLATLASIVVPPVLWLGLDRIFTGDALWSQHVLDRYDARFHPPHIALGDLATTLVHRVDPTLGWPLLVLAVVALGVSLARRPVEPAAAFAVALGGAAGGAGGAGRGHERRPGTHAHRARAARHCGGRCTPRVASWPSASRGRRGAVPLVRRRSGEGCRPRDASPGRRGEQARGPGRSRRCGSDRRRAWSLWIEPGRVPSRCTPGFPVAGSSRSGRSGARWGLPRSARASACTLRW